MTEAEEAARIEAGRVLFAAECKFFYASQGIDQLPAPLGAEIAFAGRSNVGKSSLINALTTRRTLARASNQPGRTRQLNFFDLGGRLTLARLWLCAGAEGGEEGLAGADVRLSARPPRSAPCAAAAG